MSIVDAFWAGPPVTRTWAALIFSESVLWKIGILPGQYLVYTFDKIFMVPPQVWRLMTSFGLTNDLSIIFLPYMVWMYGGWLERDCQRFASQPGSFFTYVLFCGVFCLAFGSLVWDSFVFTNMLVVAAAYTWSQENRGRPTSVYFITIDAKYMWLTIIGMTFLMGGPIAAVTEATGALAAHLYDFLTVYWPRHGGGSNLVPTPAFISAWFNGSDDRARPATEDTAYRPTAEPATGSSSGFSSWNSRGSGRRLGGE